MLSPKLQSGQLAATDNIVNSTDLDKIAGINTFMKAPAGYHLQTKLDGLPECHFRYACDLHNFTAHSSRSTSIYAAFSR